MTWTTLQRSELSPGLAGWQGGEGPSLLLIHGVGLRAESWGAMLPHLAPHFSLVVPDLPGHGASDLLKLGKPPELGDYTAKLAELLKQQSGPSLVVGHSLGALIALDLTVKYSDQVAGVVPLNAIYRRSPSAAKSVQARAAELSHSARPDPLPTVERWFGNKPVGENAIMANQCRHWLASAHFEGYREAYRVFAHEDGPADAALRQLSTNALFITGSDEPNSTPEMSLAMASLVPGGRYAVIDGARHMMPMTHASQVCHHILELNALAEGNHG